MNIELPFPSADGRPMSVKLPSYMRMETVNDTPSEALSKRFLKFECTGKDNQFVLDTETGFEKFAVVVKGSRNRVLIGSRCKLRGSVNISGDDQTVLIGARTSFNNATIICKGNANVHIGRDCMFSSSIEVRTCDGHAIIDLDTMTRTNTAASVFIGDHVWVGKGALLQKGSHVASDNVIGYGALVRGRFADSQTIIAGTPARVVRTRKTWARNAYVDPLSPQLYDWQRLPLL
jgi:acetyltransferase-like isoleucine patch superfamily enzyme